MDWCESFWLIHLLREHSIISAYPSNFSRMKFINSMTPLGIHQKIMYSAHNSIHPNKYCRKSTNPRICAGMVHSMNEPRKKWQTRTPIHAGSCWSEEEIRDRTVLRWGIKLKCRNGGGCHLWALANAWRNIINITNLTLFVVYGCTLLINQHIRWHWLICFLKYVTYSNIGIKKKLILEENTTLFNVDHQETLVCTKN